MRSEVIRLLTTPYAHEGARSTALVKLINAAGDLTEQKKVISLFCLYSDLPVNPTLPQCDEESMIPQGSVYDDLLSAMENQELVQPYDLPSAAMDASQWDELMQHLAETYGRFGTEIGITAQCVYLESIRECLLPLHRDLPSRNDAFEPGELQQLIIRDADTFIAIQGMIGEGVSCEALALYLSQQSLEPRSLAALLTHVFGRINRTQSMPFPLGFMAIGSHSQGDEGARLRPLLTIMRF